MSVLLCLCLLIVGFVVHDYNLIIASGLFAIAAEIRIFGQNKKDEKENKNEQSNSNK